MLFLEKDLEDLIYRTIVTEDGVEKLYKRGFPFLGFEGNLFTIYRQFRIADYGIIDLLLIHENPFTGFCHVYGIELKKDLFTKDHFIQASRYRTGLINMMNTFEFKNVMVDVGLIVSGVDTRTDDCYILEANYAKSPIGIYSYSLDIDMGLTFRKLSGSYHLKNQDFTNVFANQTGIEVFPIREEEAEEEEVENEG